MSLLNENDLNLLRMCGGERGNHDGYARISLAYGRAYADLRLRTRLHGQRMDILVDQSSWLNWVQPVLSANTLAQMPADLNAPLAVWTLAPLCSWLQRHGFYTPDVLDLLAEPEDEYEGWQLIVQDGERRLVLQLCDWPMEYLRKLAPCLEVDPATLARLLPFSLAVGWRQLPLEQWKSLQSGDAILLEGADPAPSSELWLCHGRPLARLRPSGQGYCVEDLSAPALAEGNAITVLAEVGRVSMSLGKWSNLQAEDRIAVATADDALVTLAAPGHGVVHASLMQVGSRLAARVC